MSTSWFSFFVLVVGVRSVDAQVINAMTAGDGPLNVLGYIVNVQLQCPESVLTRGYIQVISERYMYSVAHCSNGLKNFRRVDGATQRLMLVPSSSNDPNLCTLERRLGSQTYSLLVSGGWGERGNEVMVPELTRTVFCSYDNYTRSGRQSPVSLTDTIMAPQVVSQFMGTEYYTGSQYNLRVELAVVNIFGASIDGKTYNLGRLIKLKATPLDIHHHDFIMPISCFVGNSANKIYYVLRAGCGDGIVFNKSAGFTFNRGPNQYHSPYFAAFKLPGADDIFFECEFVICDGFCGLSSCPPSALRKRRDVDSPFVQRRPNRRITTVSGYVMMREPEQKISPLETFKVVGSPLPILPRTTVRMSDVNLKIISALAVLGAMLLVTMVTLLFVCYRQTSTIIVPLSTPKLYEKRELNNNLNSA